MIFGGRDSWLEIKTDDPKLIALVLGILDLITLGMKS